MPAILYQTCDVLIVGAGLAGFRAGIAALSQSRDLDVALATQGFGPSGSSFTNPNKALGMVVCHTDSEKELFLKTAGDIAAPGHIDPLLTTLLADDSEALYQDLIGTGLAFSTDNHGQPRRLAACFLHTPPLAYRFTRLSTAFFRLKKRFLGGGRVWEGLCLTQLIRNDENRVIGAVFEDRQSGGLRAIQCQALVMAAGGAAALFPRTLTDPDNLGFGLALMHRAGAPLVNMNYLQYMWYGEDTKHFWPVRDIASPKSRIRTPAGGIVSVPESIRSLADLRSHHAPVAHGQNDSALDDFLLDHADPQGILFVRTPERDWRKVCLYAHALNGGVCIDGQGRTPIPGLYACGECAGGMHGANRVGGAMVLSSQVFGQRAGRSSARFAHDAGLEPRSRFLDRVKHLTKRQICDADERKRGRAAIRMILAGSEGPFHRPGQDLRLGEIRKMADTARDHHLILALESARLIVEKRP